MSHSVRCNYCRTTKFVPIGYFPDGWIGAGTANYPIKCKECNERQTTT